MLTWLAIAAMIVDHIGIVFFPDHPELRAIGRVAMPLFAGMVGRNLCLTRDRGAYAERLALLAIMTQPVYMAAFGTAVLELNVIFTLLAGVWMVQTIERPQWLDLRWCWILLLPFVEYQAAGLSTVGAAYVLTRQGVSLIGLVPLYLAVVALNPIPAMPYALVGLAIFLGPLVSAQLASADRAIARRSPRWLLYAVYPGHLALFAVLASVVTQ